MIERLCHALLCAAAVSPLLHASPSAQSFECSRATTAVEKMICADRDLSRLDEEMARAYSDARTRVDTASIGQAAWLRDVRNRCTTTACLREGYESRVVVLRDLRPFPLEGLAGEWTRVEATPDESASVTISDVTATGFAFQLSAQLQLLAAEIFRTGEIEGVAAAGASSAMYVDDDSKCQVTFTRKDARLVVATSPECVVMGGMGVSFGGEFRK